jgi:hypothetical protein
MNFFHAQHPHTGMVLRPQGSATNVLPAFMGLQLADGASWDFSASIIVNLHL